MKTVTVAILAFNEEGRIAPLLAMLKKQEENGFRVSKIVVISDGSTDNTVRSIKHLSGGNVVIKGYVQNKGKAFRQNQIMKSIDTDCLVLLDADIQITDSTFLTKMVEPIMEGKADMTASYISELPPRTFFEEALDVSMKLKDILFGVFKNGSNAYTCHGPARAFAKGLYKSLVFPTRDGDDMYSYLYAVKNGFTFKYVKSALVHYRLPSNATDHYKQSVRYHASKDTFERLLGQEFVRSELNIPLKDYGIAAVAALPLLLRRPIQCAYYAIVLIWVKVKMKFHTRPEYTWSVTTSKEL